MISKNKSTKTKELTVSVALFCLFNFIPISECLFEDQIGKFDWSNHYVGKIIDGFLDDRYGQIIVATEENVLAALSADGGNIIWRRVLEKDERGSMKFLHLIDDNDAANANSVRLNSRQETDRYVITITGTSLVLLRGWSLRSGNLAWEWNLTPYTPLSNPTDTNINTHWFYAQSLLYQVVPAWSKSQIEVSAYNPKNGQQIGQTKQIQIASSQTPERCDFIKSYLVCSGVTNDDVVSTDLISGVSKTVTNSANRLKTVKGSEPLILVDGKIYNLNTNTNLPNEVTHTILYNIKHKNNINQPMLLQATVEQSNLNVKVTDGENGELLSSFVTNYPDHLNTPHVIDASCKTNKNTEFVCRIVLSTENGAVVQLQAGKIKWIREESLANIAAVEIIDLPLADSEGAIEKQLNSKNGDIVGNFIQRVTTQLNHVKHLIRTLFDVVSTHHLPSEGELTRDAFGLHTIIVVVTSSGKLFGIDNISGKHHYITDLPNFGEFKNGQKLKIVVQRTSKHFPHPARCTILGKHKMTGNGILYQFNPIDGTPINGNGITELNYAIRQISVLQPGPDFLRGILLFDKTNRVHVVPQSAAETAHGTYIYTSDKETGIVTGYYIELNDDDFEAIEIWRINLSGLDNSQKIIEIASKNPNEHVHSQGRVLNDRSVLYKYINPNLVAIVTQGTDNVYKYVLNVHLVDVVSGGIVSTITHRRVRGPVSIIHSENWLVYTYYNEKVRRTELTAIELYEGNTQANSTVWTSFDAPPLPAVEQQAYIIPANVVSLRETITEKGITNKHILIALSSGGIVEMPWHLLDPRRPVLGNNQPREEGTIPYLPELPLSSESVINYNQSIARLRGIYTAPSGLESTCLIVAYGLDFFVSRVAPSKTYDLLKEDFDYFLITTVLLGLTTASFVVKHMSAKKTLKQAWR